MRERGPARARATRRPALDPRADRGPARLRYSGDVSNRRSRRCRGGRRRL